MSMTMILRLILFCVLFFFVFFYFCNFLLYQNELQRKELLEILYKKNATQISWLISLFFAHIYVAFGRCKQVLFFSIICCCFCCCLEWLVLQIIEFKWNFNFLFATFKIALVYY